MGSVSKFNSKPEQVKRCTRIDLEHCLHWLHLEPTHLMKCTVGECSRRVQ
jgi:hypothetical protein